VTRGLKYSRLHTWALFVLESRYNNHIVIAFSDYIDLNFSQGHNELTKTLMDKLQKRGKIYVVGAEIGGKSMIRFAICSRFTTSSDINFAWDEISLITGEVLGQRKSGHPNKSLEITNGQK
jgi:hypothetical protein